MVFHCCRPVSASMATVALCVTTYIVPSLTSDCVEMSAELSRLRFQTGTRSLTVDRSICASGD